MNNLSRPLEWQRAIIILTATTLAAFAIFCLYWARAVFIPVTMAIFLSFVLSPVVSTLQRWRLGRIPSVVLVVLLAASILGGLGWVLVSQVRDLTTELPGYSENIRGKMVWLQGLGKSVFPERLQELIEDLKKGQADNVPKADTKAADRPEAKAPDPKQEPIPVTVQPDSGEWIGRLTSFLSPLVESVLQAALATVLVIFMLLKREDLRNRFIWLVGHGHMTLTTRAVEDAEHRIGRYLFMQFVVNTVYGLILTLGLMLIGVEHAALWGFLGGILRYVPYIGAPAAALFPLTLAFAQFPGWMQPMLVVVFIVCLEIAVANFVEPYVFGQSTGVSEVTLLVSAAFWAFLWGPIGLVLSGPLTVCLVVLGEHVPQLEFLAVLLGDEPALDPKVSLFQRLTARDQDEVAAIAQKHMAENSRESIYDDLLIPALSLVRKDEERNALSAEEKAEICSAIEEVLEDVIEPGQGQEIHIVSSATEPVGEVSRVRVLAMSAQDQLDRVVLQMLEQVMDAGRWEFQIVPEDMLVSEMMPLIKERDPAILCVSSLPPGGLSHTRYLCKRLRRQFPDLHIVVGRWGSGEDANEIQSELESAGVSHVASSVLGARQFLSSWHPVLSNKENAPTIEGVRESKPAEMAGAV